jgi:hypothetical protein
MDAETRVETTSVVARAIERVADALGASPRSVVVVFATCAVGAVMARMMMMTTTTTTTRAMDDDDAPTGSKDRHRDARMRALELREEALREASVSSRRLNRDERDEAAVAKRLAEIDAKAARLGVVARGKGRKLGGGTDGSSSGRPEWNPLMGGSASRGYRPTPRARPGGGG